MAINLFEGARRIAILCGGVAAIITLLLAYGKDSNYQAQYSLSAPDAPFLKTEGGCQADGRTIYFAHEASNGKIIDVSLCLEPMSFTNNNNQTVELIPYKTDADGITWGAASYSAEVTDYENQVKKRFTMSTSDEYFFLNEANKKWRNDFFETIGYLIIGLAVFGGLVVAIGWIVRGFLGIPFGKDNRPE